MTSIPPSCLRLRISCEALAKMLPASEDLAVTLFELGAREILDAWENLSEQEKGELAELAVAAASRCRTVFLAAAVQF